MVFKNSSYSVRFWKINQTENCGDYNYFVQSTSIYFWVDWKLYFDGKLEEYIELFWLFAVVGLGCQALSNSQHITTPSPPFEDNDIHIIFHTKRKSFQHALQGLRQYIHVGFRWQIPPTISSNSRHQLNKWAIGAILSQGIKFGLILLHRQ